MKTTIALMQQLTVRLAPSTGRKHSITLAEDRKTLIVALSANAGWYKFTLDEGDFDKDPATLANEILELFSQAVREEALKQAKPRG